VTIALSRPSAVEAPELDPVAVDDVGAAVAHRPLNSVKPLMATADTLAIALTMVLAWSLRIALAGEPAIAERARDLAVGCVSLPVWLATFAHYRLYTARAVTTRLDEFRRLVHAIGASMVGVAVTAFMLRIDVDRAWLALTFGVAIVTVTLEREAARRVFARMRRRGHLLRPVVIVGANTEGHALADELLADRTLGYVVVGVVDDDVVAAGQVVAHRVTTGTTADTLATVQASGACGVIIATTALDFATMNALARDLTDNGIHVELSSSLRDIHVERLTARQLGRFPVTYVEPVARHGWRPAAKRGLDLVLSLAALVVISPLMALAAVAVKLDSRGPVFFRQQRAGQHGRTFAIVKFRTMVANAEQLRDELADRNEADGLLFKMRVDPRVTRVGRLLRKLSIDELPQLWNVLRGEMSLVGPRPLPNAVDEFSAELQKRLRVRPGMTGMWQVSGRSETSFAALARHDLFYVDNWSLWTDLAIIAKTIPTVLFGRGAY